MRSAPEDAAIPLVILVGGDALALRVCEDLCARTDLRVVVLWGHAGEFAERVERGGGRFVARSPDDEESLRRAGVEQATSIVMLTDDDNISLHVALKARDLNPKIRIVLRQFNRTLGRKIEQNLENCSVISLSAHAAAFYAGTALDYECFHALQFPDIDGPLVGFSKRDPERIGPGERLITVDEKSERAVVFGRIRSNVSKKAPALPPVFQRWFRSPNIFQRLAREYARIDTLLRVVIAFALAVVVAATLYFAAAANLDWLQAFYFVVTTMTTTGFGDQPAQAAARPGLAVTIFLMLAGVALTGVFYAVLTTKFTQAQWIATQGLRHVARSGHVVVCGTGNVGSRVIDYLTAIGRRVVAVEAHPSHEIVERARDNHFDLLTGDATQDATLDLCNLGHAEALVALTDSDTNNLEVALGARARNPALPIVMRCQEAQFASAIARHFGIDHTYGTAALAAPAVAGLARFPGARGRVTIGALDYEIVEERINGDAALAQEGVIPLAVWRDGHLAMIFDYAEAKPGDVVLTLRPGL